MTKLLYVPTGEYITFWSSKYSNETNHYTVIIEDLDKDCYNMFDGIDIIEDIMSLELVDIEILKRNRIKRPIVREDFEIIYD